MSGTLPVPPSLGSFSWFFFFLQQFFFVCNCHLSIYVVLLAFYKSNVVILPYISKWSKLVNFSSLWIVQRQEKLTSLLHFEDSGDILRYNTTITKGEKVTKHSSKLKPQTPYNIKTSAQQFANYGCKFSPYV